MRLRVSTPARELELDPLIGLRFLGPDGWRGVWPGHEPARARVVEGPLRCLLPGSSAQADPRAEPELRWLATEGGVIFIDRVELRILTRWAASAASLVELRGLVEARDAERRRLEDEARSTAHRHEVATRRALVALERKITSP